MESLDGRIEHTTLEADHGHNELYLKPRSDSPSHCDGGAVVLAVDQKDALARATTGSAPARTLRITREMPSRLMVMVRLFSADRVSLRWAIMQASRRAVMGGRRTGRG